ncbi:MAG: GNAT family N-acetyltransferase, partial [Pirellulaceae bacterium]
MFGRIQSTGWKYSLAIAFNRVVPRFLFRCRRFIVFDAAPPEQLSGEVVFVSWAKTEEELLAAERLTGALRSQISGPVRAAIARDDHKIVGGLWCCESKFEEADLGVTIQLTDNQCWLFSGYVDRDYRQRGVYSQLISFVIHHQGSRQCLLAINPDNRRSMQAHRRLGISPLGRVVCARFLAAVWGRASGDITANRSWTS